MSDKLNPGHVRLGHFRFYDDHTGRWYEDITQVQYNMIVEEAKNDPMFSFMAESIKEEIDKKIVKTITKVMKNV